MKNTTILTSLVVAMAIAGTAYAAGENVVSSKAYVDSGISQKQGIISHVANANTAMLFPTTTGAAPQPRVISTEVGNDTNLVTRGGVNTALNTKQETVNGVSGSANKVVLYNSTGGLSGSNNPAKAVYNSGTAYTGQGENLVEAQHVNGAVANGFNAHLTCSDCGGAATCDTTNCNLYQVNTLNASTTTYVPQTTSGN